MIDIYVGLAHFIYKCIFLSAVQIRTVS